MNFSKKKKKMRKIRRSRFTILLDLIPNIFFMLVKIFTTLFDPSSRRVKSVKWTFLII